MDKEGNFGKICSLDREYVTVFQTGETVYICIVIDVGGVGESSEKLASGGGESVMAAAGTVGSISVSLHPLVILNISEHWTRQRAQEGKPVQGNLFVFV